MAKNRLYRFLILDSNGKTLCRLLSYSYKDGNYGTLIGNVIESGVPYMLVCATHAWAAPIVDAKSKSKIKQFQNVVTLSASKYMHKGGWVRLDITLSVKSKQWGYIKYLKPLKEEELAD